MPKQDAEWKFKQNEPGDVERNPREGEFFRQNELVEALVREVIQNSLDARPNGNSLVTVRHTFGEVSKSDVARYLQGLAPHLEACGTTPDHSDNDSMSFLTIEDFGTTGLDGPIGDDGSRPEKSNFYDFWFREGISGKRGGAAGRWGLGKTMFHIASGIRSFWGLTVRRDDDKELLMGKALLQTHKIKGKSYRYYGHYLIEGQKAVSEPAAIKDFKKTFLLTRNDEAGLSLVIPMPPNEINPDSVRKAVMLQYFYPIMKGNLKVEIKSGGRLELNEGNLTSMACSEDWQGTSWAGVDVTELMQFIESTIHPRDSNEDTELQIDEERPEISEQCFAPDLVTLKDAFSSGNLLSFRIPITISKFNQPTSQTCFFVHLQKSPKLAHSEEYYVRSGITIDSQQMKTLGSRQVRALLVAEDPPITEFLGDAEPPAHNEWNERIAGSKGKYENAARKLRFIKKSMSRIVLILDTPPQERLLDYLRDIISIAPEESREQPDEGAPNRPKPPPPPPPPKPPDPFRIGRRENGFTITLNDKNMKLPVRAKVLIAYNTARGNPFRKYSPYDFDLAASQMPAPQLRGGRILKTEGNRIELRITDSDFKLEITGFDSRRDLKIDVKKEDSNEADD